MPTWDQSIARAGLTMPDHDCAWPAAGVIKSNRTKQGSDSWRFIYKLLGAPQNAYLAPLSDFFEKL